LAEYEAIARVVPWAAVHERQPYQHDPTRQAPSTLLPHQVGTVAVCRRPYVRIVGVPRSPQASLGVMLAEPRRADAVPRSLPVTEEAWAVPADFPLSDTGDVPPSTEEAAASAAYHARKWRHAGMERGGPAQPGSANPGYQAGAAPDVPVGPAAFPAPGSLIHELGSHGPGSGEREARARRSACPGAGPRGGAASPSAANTDWDRYPTARDDGSGAVPDGRWAEERHDDYPDTAGAEFRAGWPIYAGSGAGGTRRDPGDRMDGRLGRGAGAWDDRAWPAASLGDGRSPAAAGRNGPMTRTDGGQGRGRDAHAGRHWGAEPQRDGGGYPTGGAGAAAGSQRDVRDGRHWRSESRRDGGESPSDAVGKATGGPRSALWDAGPDKDSPAAALLELEIVGLVATPVPEQPDVAYDWSMSSLWEPPAPMTATAWLDSLTSGKVVDLLVHDGAVNLAEVTPPELTAALVEYSRIGLAGVVNPCLETPRTREKGFHAALRCVLCGDGRPVHV